MKKKIYYKNRERNVFTDGVKFILLLTYIYMFFYVMKTKKVTEIIWQLLVSKIIRSCLSVVGVKPDRGKNMLEKGMT